MAIVVNGVNLPDVPADVLANYPYAVIKMMTSVDDNGEKGEAYLLSASTQPIGYIYMPENGPTDNAFLVTATEETVTYAYDGSSWQFQDINELLFGYYVVGFVPSDGMSMSFYGETTTFGDLTYELMWVNHDIETVTFSSEGTIEPTGEVFYSYSTYEPAYFMSADWFRSMGAQARRLGGTNSKLTPDDMFSIMKGVEPLGPQITKLDNLIGQRTDLSLAIYSDVTEPTFDIDDGTTFIYVPDMLVDYIDTVVFPNLLSIPNQFLQRGGGFTTTNLRFKTAIFNSATGTLHGMAFAEQDRLVKIVAPKITKLDSGWRNSTLITEITRDWFPEVTEIGYQGLVGLINLTRADFPKLSQLTQSSFGDKLQVLVLRNTEKVCTSSWSFKDTFGKNSLIAKGKGCVLVPTVLMDSYSAYTDWINMTATGSKLLPLESYTVDGTLTGDIDWAKVEAELAKL